MNLIKFSNILTVGLIALLFSSCGDDTINNPLVDDISVTLQNTLESKVVSGFETETNFKDPATNLVSEEVEFPAFVDIYDIDVDDSTMYPQRQNHYPDNLS